MKIQTLYSLELIHRRKLLKSISGIKNNPNLHVADSIFELHYVMGGINNATSFSDDTVTEASNYAVASFCNNVVGKIDFLLTETLRQDISNH